MNCHLIIVAEITGFFFNYLDKAIKTAPSKITIHGREEKNDVVLEKNRVHFGVGGTVMVELINYGNAPLSPLLP
jgi:trimethylamine:corrinoid methyltransferase-like protein